MDYHFSSLLFEIKEMPEPAYVHVMSRPKTHPYQLCPIASNPLLPPLSHSPKTF